jgi:hypothetical protein
MIRALNAARKSPVYSWTLKPISPVAITSRSLSLVSPDGRPLIPPNLPKEARVVVIGAGVIGTSIGRVLNYIATIVSFL